MEECTYIYILYMQVNEHDTISNEQGILTYKHRWIFLAELDSLKNMEREIQNITHLSAIAPLNVIYRIVIYRIVKIKKLFI